MVSHRSAISATFLAGSEVLERGGLVVRARDRRSFVFEFVLPQLAAIALGIITLAGVKQGRRRGGWMAIVGVVLGVLYTFLFIAKSLQRAAGMA